MAEPLQAWPNSAAEALFDVVASQVGPLRVLVHIKPSIRAAGH
jgi:hypothetical protein